MFLRIFMLLLIFLYSSRVTLSNGIKSNLLPDRHVCGKQVEERIFGGTETSIGEFPWLVLLESSEHGLTCGGALINSRYVLTAAHCVDEEIVRVRLGEHNVKKDEDCEGEETPGFEFCADPIVNVDVEERIVHKNFDSRDKNAYSDIALLRLKKEVTYTRFIQPICLPSISSELRTKNFEGERVVVAGWGRTEKKWESDAKLKVELPVKSNKDCAKVYQQHEIHIANSQICAGGEKGKDSCEGDSGGPLMYRDAVENDENWVCIGIVSFGTEEWDRECGTENVPAVYTRVTDYLPWIMNNIKP